MRLCCCDVKILCIYVRTIRDMDVICLVDTTAQIQSFTGSEIDPVMHPAFKVHQTTASRFKLRTDLSAARHGVRTLKVDRQASRQWSDEF